MTSSRLRKVSCEECGYTIRMTRSWMLRGFPQCPCGATMQPADGSDLAFCGLLSQDDVPARVWTQICRENGWEDCIVRKGAAAKTWTERRKQLRPAHADHCAFPGCGRWIAEGADHCSAGHAQHDDAPRAEVMPF